MLIINSNNKVIKSTKNILNSRFYIKDTNLADVKLGAKITRILDGLILSQSHYVGKILEKFRGDDADMARTKIDTSQHLYKNKDGNVSQVEYIRIIESLMHLMSCTKPYMAYRASNLSR